jgi:putative RecB family exonuclease
MAFRFSSVEKIPEPPSIHATRGTIVHRALEILFGAPQTERTAGLATNALDQAFVDYADHPDLVDLNLSPNDYATLQADCAKLLGSYLEMEDPQSIRDIGLELRLETVVDTPNLPDGLTLRGIIDRLELDHEGELVITDYKTGRTPGPRYQQSSLASMQFYALLCREVLGQTPAEVRLMYLKSKDVISATPTDQSLRHLLNRTTAVHAAVARACETGDFKPNAGPLCRSCSYQPWCPEFGGNPDAAAIEAPVAFGLTNRSSGPS